METACELCNAMKKMLIRCCCGETMLDSGPVTDYSGPYSPYYNTNFENPYCHHLFTCPLCGRDRVISVQLRKI